MTDAQPIERRGPISAIVRPPGSKSITNRALLIAALADGASVLEAPLRSDDTIAMRSGLEALGIEVHDEGSDLAVMGGQLQAATRPLDVDLSGTSLRFLVAAASLAPGQTVIDGKPRIRERPIRELTDALVRLGVDVALDPATGGAPVTVSGHTLSGGPVVMDGSVSSQPVSALMMVAPYAQSPVSIRFSGAVVSRPYLHTTAEVMSSFGIEASFDADEIAIPLGQYRARAFPIEADASAAVYPWCAAAITGGSASVVGIPASSTQADLAVLSALTAMGCEVRSAAGTITVTGPARLNAISMDLEDCPDGAMAVVVAAAFADGPSTISGLASWSVKETDRLAAVSGELSKLGVGVQVSPASLVVTPSSGYQGATIATYDDHRMAMAFSLAGLRIDGVRIDDPAVVSKTWPEYWTEFSSWS